MEKILTTLTTLPNFTILAETTTPYLENNLVGILSIFCEVSNLGEHIDSYKLTPKSFWRGMNTLPEENFLKLLKSNSKDSLPENVVQEIKDLRKKFGVVTLVGDDCLKIKSKELIKELQHNTKLKEYIYEIEGNLVFFEGTTIKNIADIFEHDLGHPIKIRTSRIKTFLVSDSFNTFAVKANNSFEAFKKLYGVHKGLNEENFKRMFNHRREEFNDEDISDYLEKVFNKHSDSTMTFEVKEIPSKSTYEAVCIK